MRLKYCRKFDVRKKVEIWNAPFCKITVFNSSLLCSEYEPQMDHDYCPRPKETKQNPDTDLSSQKNLEETLKQECKLKELEVRNNFNFIEREREKRGTKKDKTYQIP